MLIYGDRPSVHKCQKQGELHGTDHLAPGDQIGSLPAPHSRAHLVVHQGACTRSLFANSWVVRW